MSVINPHKKNPMTMSGFCAFPSKDVFDSHEFCQAMQSSNTRKCTCPCHQKKEKK